jgi:hypothetical protein
MINLNPEALALKDKLVQASLKLKCNDPRSRVTAEELDQYFKDLSERDVSWQEMDDLRHFADPRTKWVIHQAWHHSIRKRLDESNP